MTFFYIFDQINAALMSIRNFFKKTLIILLIPNFWMAVYVCNDTFKSDIIYLSTNFLLFSVRLCCRYWDEPNEKRRAECCGRGSAIKPQRGGFASETRRNGRNKEPESWVHPSRPRFGLLLWLWPRCSWLKWRWVSLQLTSYKND